jgi:UDP-N-acetylglucosamine 1-carboxyvinyltransferase
MQHIERGYDDIENRLRSLGAQVGIQQPELALAAD